MTDAGVSFLFLWNLLTRHERRLAAAVVRRLQSGRQILAMGCVPGRPAVRFFRGRRALLREALEGLNSAVTARSTAEPHARSPGRLGARAVPARSTWHGRKGVGYCGLRAHGPKRPHVGCYEFMERPLGAANPGLNDEIPSGLIEALSGSITYFASCIRFATISIAALFFTIIC